MSRSSGSSTPLGQLLSRGLASALHPLGKTDLFLGGQQGDAPDFLQVEADGVVDVDQVQVNIQLCGLTPLLFRRLAVLFLPESTDLDALFEQVGEQVLELFHVGLSFRKGIQDVIVSHKALVAPQGEQLRGGFSGLDGGVVLPFSLGFGLEI